ATIGQLAPIVLHVGKARDDQDRLGPAGELIAIGVEDDARLLGVGRTGDEGEGHALLTVASRADGCPGTGAPLPCSGRGAGTLSSGVRGARGVVWSVRE